MSSTSSRESKNIVLRTIGIISLVEVSLMMAWTWMFGPYEGLHFGRWQIAEWLINYQSGFVRRGLAGQFFYWLGDGSNLLQYLYHWTFYFYLTYCLVFLAVYFLAKVRQPKLLLLAILIPGGIFQMGLTIQFFTRKEILFLILFGLICVQYLCAQRSAPRFRTAFYCLMYGLAIVGGSALTLVHEGYLFMSYPLTLLLFWVIYQENTKSNLVRLGGLLYCLVIPVFFFLCAIQRGDANIAQSIWYSLSLADRLSLSASAPYTAFGPIASLGWGYQQNALTIYGMVVTGGWMYWLGLILGNFLVLAYIVFNLNLALQTQAPQKNTKIIFLFFLGLLLSSSMFLIAADWGRWLSYLSNSLMMFLFAMNQSSYALLVSDDHSTVANKVRKNILTNKGVYIALVLYCLSFKLSECCIAAEYLFMPYGDILKSLTH